MVFPFQPKQAGRRNFIRTLGAGAVALGGLSAPARGVPLPPGVPHAYLHGVASGDPLADRVILWTRVTPRAAGPVPVFWDVALDRDFRRIVRRGRLMTSEVLDYTVKVDVPGLSPATVYWYRFSTGAVFSPVGRTRTLPIGAVSKVKLAVFSCSNYPAGYFHAFAEAAKLDDVDCAVHLGDYIYEYGRDEYASESAAQLDREVNPAGELLVLEDYRTRYAQYRGDPDLQALHAKMPMIAVWDDHEIANDTWKGGAENHQPDEGSFFARRDAAIRAYHEWMPTRLPNAAQPLRIYRSFDFGNLVSLHMMDTRLIGRDQQLNYANYFGASGFDAARFTRDLSQPGRQLIGTEQTAWLQQRLATSTATWQVLGQQILIGRMNIPAPLVLGQISFSNYAALLARAQSNPHSLSATEQAVLAQPAIPYNLDAWDGYAVARETVFGTARALQKNLVVLSGDTHNAWANELADYAGNRVGVEFATPGVSSPGFEAYFPNENPQAVAAGLTALIGPLVWADTEHRGYMLVTATPDACTATWPLLSTVKEVDYTVISSPTATTLPGAAGRGRITLTN